MFARFLESGFIEIGAESGDQNRCGSSCFIFGLIGGS